MSSLSYFVTTVLTPAASADLTTAATVMDDWGIAAKDQAFVARAVTRCSMAASDFCNRAFGITEYKTVVRLERGYKDGHLTIGDISPIMFPFFPIASISSIIETDENGVDTTLVEGTDYEVVYNVGKIFRLDSYGRQRDWWTRKKVTITCKAGFVLPGQNLSDFPGASLLPAHLEDAVGRMVATRYFERNRDPFVKSEVVEGIGRTDYITLEKNPDGGNMSADVIDILNNFRVPVIG